MIHELTKARVAFVRSLRDKRYRDESGLFVAEGVKLVDGSVYLNKKSAEYTLKEGTLSVKVGDISEGKEAVVTFKVTVRKGMAGKTITNTAVAKGDNGTAEDKSYTATDKGVSINQGDIKPHIEKKASKKTNVSPNMSPGLC